MRERRGLTPTPPSLLEKKNQQRTRCGGAGGGEERGTVIWRALRPQERTRSDGSGDAAFATAGERLGGHWAARLTGVSSRLLAPRLRSRMCGAEASLRTRSASAWRGTEKHRSLERELSSYHRSQELETLLPLAAPADPGEPGEEKPPPSSLLVPLPSGSYNYFVSFSLMVPEPWGTDVI